MEFPVARNPQVKWKTGMLNEAEEMKDADFPEIRLFHVEHQLAPDDEKEDCVGKWVVCNPDLIITFQHYRLSGSSSRCLYHQFPMTVC